MLLCIDPGNCTGWAVFHPSGFLQSAGVTTLDAARCPAVGALVQGDVNRLLIEVPQVYQASLSKGDPNDLIKVAIGVGRWVERATVCGASVTAVKTAQWKGQVPKEVHHKRVMAALQPGELALLPKLPQSQGHNMLDAVALGLWDAKRIR
jgi:hypothetical protein